MASEPTLHTFRDKYGCSKEGSIEDLIAAIVAAQLQVVILGQGGAWKRGHTGTECVNLLEKVLSASVEVMVRFQLTVGSGLGCWNLVPKPELELEPWLELI